MSVELSSNVPIPPVRRKRSFNFPIDTLEVGGSLFVPLSGKTTKDGRPVEAARLSTSVSVYSKKTGKKFTTRIMYDEGKVGCWRVA